MKYFNLVQTVSTYSWVFLPVLGYLVAFFIVEIFFKSNRFWLKAWNHKFNWLNRLDFNIFISLVCVSYFVLIKYLNHLSFQTSAFDFAIFDQNFFVQSQGIFPPINSVRGMSNLWIDHQHFSQIILAPLYWINSGMSGLVMIFLSPLLLILIPSVLVYLSYKNLTENQAINQTNYWIIGFSSLILSIHPYTQSAIEFYYHEQYLFSLFFGLVVYFITRYFSKRDRFSLYGLLFSYIGWLGVKEDQWLYILTFFLSLVILGIVFCKRKIFVFIKANKVFVFINSFFGIFSLIYWELIQRWMKSVSPNWSGYISNYTQFKNVTEEFVQTGNVSNYWNSLPSLREDVSEYMYQHFLHFDIFGIILFPFSICVNYAIRLFSSNQFLRHPWFHYGSEVPTIVIFGIIFTYFLFIKYNKKQLAQKFIYFILISYIFGFISIIGWSSNIDTQRVNNYSFFSLKNAKLGYLTTSDERQDLNYVKQFIKPNYKLRTSREYMPQFSARLNLSYLYGIDGPEGLEKMKSDEYNYWLIPKKAEQDKIYIKSLKQNNLKIIVETSNQILFKTN